MTRPSAGDKTASLTRGTKRPGSLKNCKTNTKIIQKGQDQAQPSVEWTTNRMKPAIATWDKDFESAIGDGRFEKSKLMGWERAVYPITRALFKLQEGLLKKVFYFLSFLKDKRFKSE